MSLAKRPLLIYWPSSRRWNPRRFFSSRSYVRTFNPSPKKHFDSEPDFGFTLLELILVLVIIMIVTSAAMMGYVIARDKARIASCRVTMDTVKKGLDSYITENNVYPPDGSISAIQDIKDILEDRVNFLGKTTCEDPVLYTSNDTSYKLETRVHYTGGGTGGVKLVLENGDMTEAAL